MIKVFGKIRYHWQPDIALSIAYWSLTISIFFIGWVLTFERTHVYWLTFVVWAIFLFFCVLGMHRHFWIEDNKEFLHIVSLWGKHRADIPISSITKILVSSHGVVIFSDRWDHGRIYYMRKGHRKPFIKDITNRSTFNAEIEEIGQITYEKQK